MIIERVRWLPISFDGSEGKLLTEPQTTRLLYRVRDNLSQRIRSDFKGSVQENIADGGLVVSSRTGQIVTLSSLHQFRCILIFPSSN